MCLLTLAVSMPALRPPSCGNGVKEEDCTRKASALQVGIFYGALYIIAVGTGGTKPNISTMGADQFDDFDTKERNQKLSFFNWWMFSIFFGTLFSNTFLIYIQDNVGYSLGYGLPTIGLLVSVLVFLVGTRFYRHKVPSDQSPTTRIVKALVAAIRKWHVPVPSDPKELHELSLEDYAEKGKLRIEYTPLLRLILELAISLLRTLSMYILHLIEQLKYFLFPVLVSRGWQTANRELILKNNSISAETPHHFKLNYVSDKILEIFYLS